jgi:hypothetical protein
MDWSEVDLAGGLIEVKGTKANMGRKLPSKNLALGRGLWEKMLS